MVDVDPHTTARKKRFPLRIDGLAVRLALGITLLVVGLLAAVFTVSARHHYDATVAVRRRAGELEGRILETTLRHEMLEKDAKLLAAILQEVGTQPEVHGAMIVDHKGVVRVASRPDLVGQEVRRDSSTCRVCHDKSAEDRERWVLLEEPNVLRTVRPIENRAECHKCHDPANRFNGMLVLDLSLAPMQEQLRRDAAWMAAGTGVLAFLLLAGVTLLVQRLVLARLNRLSHAAQSIAGGDLSERAPVEGRDRIGRLARDFNSMADAVSGLIAEVRGRETQLTQVMNSLDDGLVVFDHQMRVVGSNLSFGRRVGIHPEALHGLRCRDAATPPLCGRPSPAECLAARCLATGSLQRAVFRTPADNGEIDRVEEVHASPILDAQGKVEQVVEIWRDITERVKEEERLAEIERLVSLGVLASGFSHEVNTPLASTLVSAESILGRIDDAGAAGSAPKLEEIRQSADTIRKEVLRCRKITEQFLRFARGIPPSIEPIDLRKVVTGVVGLVEATAREAGVSVRLEGDDAIPTMSANTEVVQHVVLNLLVNAVQSCERRGGAVTVSLHADPEVRIRVRDTGCGIPPERRDHLFEPFRSSKPQGTGLGLFLSRSFARRFGGNVRLVESEVGVGSCFEIVFPKAGGPFP
ncbi:MAG: PAS domain-containing protein [Planctomycetes bacterium]|nr:PAS domain-containing protein [Planctomycetota bacterium]